MMTSLRKNRAILLVTTLLFALLLIIAVVAALNLSGRSLLSAENSEDVLAAQAALEAGSQYALARLQERPSWRGDGDGVSTTALTVEMADLVVMEDHGNVVGLLRGEGATPSQFRIRFNYHDGPSSSSGDADGLDDPTTLSLEGPWVSINNLMSGASTPVPRADQTRSGVWSVQASSDMPLDAPPYTAVVMVEGLAGESLREQFQAGGSYDFQASLRGQKLTRKVGEFYFRRRSAAAARAASYSAGDLDVTVSDGGVFRVLAEDAGDVPRIKSNEDVMIQALGGAATYDSPGGEVYVETGAGRFDLNGSASTTPTAIQRSTPRGEFLELQWRDIKKATASDAAVRAGTYVWRDGGGVPYLEYYNQTFDPVSGSYPAGSGLVVGSPADMLDRSTGTSALTLDPSRLRVEFTESVMVENQPGGAEGLAIIPETAITDSGRRPTVEFTGTGTNAPIMTSEGNVTFKGRLVGTGSVTSEGTINFQGSSVLEAGSSEVALYAKDDIILEAIPDEVVAALGGGTTVVGTTTTTTTTTGVVGGAGPGSRTCGVTTTSTTTFVVTPLITFTHRPPAFQDQEVRGVIFTMGNFLADLDGVSYRGNLALQGVIAAYGGDPEAGQAPGADSTGGRITIQADSAGFIYDPEYVERVIDLNAPTPLVTTLSNYL